MRILMIMTQRSEDGLADPGLLRLDLSALDDMASQEMLDRLMGRDVTLQSIRQRIVAKAQGNPLFLEELVQSLAEAGSFRGEPGNYGVSKPAGRMEIPQTIHTVLAARIDRLDGVPKALLQTSAVIGADVSIALLSGILEVAPGKIARDLKTLEKADPRIALIEDNTDNFVTSALSESMAGMVDAYNEDEPGAARIPSQARLDVVEVYPFVPYIQYLLSGTILLAIFTMVMIGGGIIFIDDKARGLHEGYLVTPVTKLELILGFNLSGTIKAVIAGCVLITIGSLIAGVPAPFMPLRLLRMLVVVVMTAVALVSMMFLLMVRMSDPLLPRAMFGVLNTLLYFPSGAVYPQQGFPKWLQMIAVVDPFTYGVHALKCLLLKDTGFGAIWGDLLFLLVFTIIMMAGATRLFRRTL